MAKSGLRGISPEETFRKMFLPQGAQEDASASKGRDIDGIPPTPKEDSASPSTSLTHNEATTTGEKPPQKKKKTEPPKGVKLYLSRELDEALARRCYLDRSKNRSAHVRAALEAYLKDDLDALKGGDL